MTTPITIVPLQSPISFTGAYGDPVAGDSLYSLEGKLQQILLNSAVYTPATMTTADINAAIIQANANGGGIVQLPAGVITLTGTLNLLAGVVINGSGTQMSSTYTLQGGTVLTASSNTFPLISGNANDLGSAYGSAASFTAQWISGCGVANLGLNGGTYGIKMGALYNPGPANSLFLNLTIINATVFGMWIENMSQCSIERIFATVNANGICLMGSGTTVWNTGNTHLRKVIANGNLGANGCGRGLWVSSRASSQLNNINIFDIGGSGTSVTSTQACTFSAPITTTITSGSASIAATNTFAAGDQVTFSATVGTSGGQVVISTAYYVSATGLSGTAFQVSATSGGTPITFNASGTPNVLTCKFGVTDLSKFGVGMPIYFSATANGFTINIIYFVQSVSGTSGSGYLTACAFMGGTGGQNSIGSTGSTAVNVVTNGWPIIEVGGSDPGSLITWSSIKGCSDVEIGGTAHIVLQALFGFDFEGGTIHSAVSKTDICVRNVTGQSIRIYCGQSYNLDCDYTAQKIQVNGIQPVSLSANYAGVGFTVSGTQGFGQLNLVGTSTPDIYVNSNFYNQIQMQNAFALKHTTQTTGATIATASGNIVTFITAAGGTLTLPNLTSTNMVGWLLQISNPTANTVTISSTQNIVGFGVSSTTLSLPTLTNVMLVAQNNNGTMYWAMYADTTLATATGTGTVKVPTSGSLLVDSSGNLTALVGTEDPTNTTTLGAPAILRGTVQAHLVSGVTQGSGQSQATRTATLAALQAAINYADTNGKFFEIEPGIYEIYGSVGLVIPASSGSTFQWHGTKGSHIYQFYANAPILTIGDIGNNNYAGSQRISGFTLDHGVSQTGNTLASGLLLGAAYGMIVEDFQVCTYYGTNPPYNGVYINSTNTSNAYFFSNVIRDFQIGGCQRSLFAWHLGGTGNVVTNGYTHNGASSSTRNACSAAAWDLTVSGIQSDNIIERCNIEHLVASPIMQIQGFTSTTFTGLHLEDVAITGYGPNVIYQIGGHVKYINTNILDLVQTSASGPCSIFGSSGYGDYTDVNGLYMKWDSSFSAVMNLATTMISQPSNQGNDTCPGVTVSNVRIEDDTGNNATYLTLDSNTSTPLLDGTIITKYQGDNLVPSTTKFQLTVKANYTHYGLHTDAVLFVPASLGAAITITLSNKRKASGTGSSLITMTGNTVRIRRQSGTYANSLTVVDAAGSTTLTTNTTSGADYIYVFGGTNWAAAT